MQRTLTNIALSYFVIIGAQLMAFSLLGIEAPLWQDLTIAAIFTAISTLLGWHNNGEQEWTLNESDNFSTTETESIAT